MEDLSKEEMQEMAAWFQQFFRYLELDQEMKKLWKQSPFKAVRLYKRYQAEESGQNEQQETNE